MKTASLDEFYHKLAALAGTDPSGLLPSGIQREIGHFNVFNLEDLLRHVREKPTMPFDRRAYYKISLITGRSRAEYADKVIAIDQQALLFATPKVPYHWVPDDLNQVGLSCVFTADFMLPAKSGAVLDELPIFRAGGYPVFQVSAAEHAELRAIFQKMQQTIGSEYAYKYDLLRTYVLELIHFGQRLQPAPAEHPMLNASARVSSLFIELLERQFPVSTPQQRLQLRTAGEFADRLAVHVNHLNRVLKETTGRTTTDLIAGRLLQEAKTLLQETNWTVSEIADCLGFAEVAHFSHFFKRHTSLSPLAFRA
ncbi:helix-turn-helix domain-containing protein [Hymenobacter jeollabukensis]|uniref:Helix-turn-helix domain-containing protein n=1 Tax=Hymenobacter jeollabukensis TaxID=2025313 RepID=A0A5R8WUV1_9BACT|nr:helix-turn-helix transcriptional regulator [Hymenobacter jeollabukensis]TLM95548.1 helix-turn-helix domain-containing protein [Hymenobacter jeollabukensis]